MGGIMPPDVATAAKEPRLRHVLSWKSARSGPAEAGRVSGFFLLTEYVTVLELIDERVKNLFVY